MEKKRKPPNGKWVDVLEEPPKPDRSYDPYGVDPDWRDECELDGERLPLRGLREQLYSDDAKGIIVTRKSDGLTLRPWRDDMLDDGGDYLIQTDERGNPLK